MICIRDVNEKVLSIFLSCFLKIHCCESTPPPFFLRRNNKLSFVSYSANYILQLGLNTHQFKPLHCMQINYITIRYVTALGFFFFFKSVKFLSLNMCDGRELLSNSIHRLSNFESCIEGILIPTN